MYLNSNLPTFQKTEDFMDYYKICDAANILEYILNDNVFNYLF